MNGSGGSGSGRGLGFSSWLPWGNSNGGSGRRQNGAAAMAGEFDLDPMPVPEYVPGVARASFVGTGMATEARLWRAGEEFDSFGDAPFARGVPATGFIHSGLLNRLYAWLDVIAYGTSR
ncbi:hypothetical protein LPJ66_011031 [Kickxella alabastrina]|uniref:Uncharacterized protein n=1 Tax=Kickxella alabastrina TaxID=61397 RepID=A0ACC1I1A6_9FUNG|nr:hypothetical protein LPJ66_011031 [Kickxella alabastrina]